MQNRFEMVSLKRANPPLFLLCTVSKAVDNHVYAMCRECDSDVARGAPIASGEMRDRPAVISERAARTGLRDSPVAVVQLRN